MDKEYTLEELRHRYGTGEEHTTFPAEADTKLWSIALAS